MSLLLLLGGLLDLLLVVSVGCSFHHELSVGLGLNHETEDGSTGDDDSACDETEVDGLDESLKNALGRAVMGKRVGDRVLVKVNDDIQYYVQIRSITKGADDDSLPIHSF